jgi:hypothetical protein
MKNKQTGFAVIDTLLILVIIAIVAGTGYYVLHSKSQVGSSLSNADNSSQSQAVPKKTVASKNSTTDNSSQKYTVIKEWGVRASYSGTDTITYKMEAGNRLATFVSANLTKAYPDCSTMGAGQVMRFSPSDPAYADGTGPTVKEYSKQYPSDYTIVKGYYYRFAHDQAACASDASQQNQANTEVSDLVKSFEPIPNS